MPWVESDANSVAPRRRRSHDLCNDAPKPSLPRMAMAVYSCDVTAATSAVLSVHARTVVLALVGRPSEAYRSFFDE
jgi:hypothetical protein